MTDVAIKNRKVILAARPVGIPQAEHFDFAEEPVREPKSGEFLVHNKFLSVDPAMRGWLNAAANYSDPVEIGDVMRAVTVGEVTESRNDDFAVGDLVVGQYGWQEYAIGNGSELRFRVEKSDLSPSLYLGTLGSTGLTAYFGLTEWGQPKAGETVVVSTAAGSVGSTVGQIAKLLGCRTVGITGSDEKVGFCVEDFGYDAAINYKTDDLDAKLAEYCPDGVDVYFDNTSGPISDAVYQHFAVGARSVVCGTASIAVWDPLPTGPRIERTLLVKRARLQGLFIFDFRDRWPDGVKQLETWYRDGKLHAKEHFLDGLDEAPGAIQRLYSGENLGKLMIRL